MAVQDLPLVLTTELCPTSDMWPGDHSRVSQAAAETRDFLAVKHRLSTCTRLVCVAALSPGIRPRLPAYACQTARRYTCEYNIIL
jgi:hypothetical protein